MNSNTKYSSDYNKLIHKAREHGSNLEWDKAIEFYEEAFKTSIDSYDMLDLAICYLEIDEKEKALETIDFVIGLDEDDSKAYFYKGLYYDHLMEKEEALKWFIVSETKLKSKEDDEEIAELFFKIGLLYDELSDEKDNDELLENAISYYNKALEHDEYHYFTNLNLGSIYEKQNILDKALEHSLKAYNTNTEESFVCYNLGVIYSKLNDMDSALKYYLEETEREEPYPYVYYNLGIIYKDMKDYKKSKEYYLEGLKHLKNDPSIWYNLGCVHALNNDFANAYDCLSASIILNSKIINYLEEDNELNEFIKSDMYNKLKNKYKI